jgi:hypothetical protein
MKRNVEGAQLVGWQAIQFQTPYQLRHDLSLLLNSR